MLEFIVPYGSFCVLEPTSGDPVVGFLAICQTMTVDWNVLRYVEWLSYLSDTGVVHTLEDSDGTVRDEVESAK